MFLGVRLKVYGRIRFEARLYGSSAYLIERSTSSSFLFESNHVRGAILACLFVGVASVYDRGPPTLPRFCHVFSIPICIFIFISNERCAKLFLVPDCSSPRIALPLADSIKILPRWRLNIARKLPAKPMFRKKNELSNSSFSDHESIFRISRLRIRWFEWKIWKLENWAYESFPFQNFDHRERIGYLGTPVSRYFDSYYSWKRCGYTVPVYPGRSVHSGPIDNRWNKKLEFVYSLVTQIRAAILPYPLLLSSPFHLHIVIVDTNNIQFTSSHRHGHQNQHQRHITPPPSFFRSRYFIFPRFSLRRFVPSDEFAHPAPECICQTLKQIGRQLTNTSVSVTSTT